MKEVQLQTTYTEEHLVKEHDLAVRVGSGEVAVLATPMMIAWMEHASAACLKQYLEAGETSVGVMMNTTHDAATPCGMKVEISVEIIAVDRKKVTFEVIAKDEKDIIGRATHARVVVNQEKFEQRALSKAGNEKSILP